MGKFYDTHKNFVMAKEIDEKGSKYTRFDSTGTYILEQWTKINGKWVDTTEKTKNAMRKKTNKNGRL